MHTIRNNSLEIMVTSGWR